MANLTAKKILGNWGEEQARKFLEEKGFKWIESNFKYKKGEIDLIMKNGNDLVFVEVKTKSDDYSGDPADNVDRKKIQQIEWVVGYILQNIQLKNNWGFDDEVKWQVDIVAVYGDGRQVFDIMHYENVTFWE